MTKQMLARSSEDLPVGRTWASALGSSIGDDRKLHYAAKLRVGFTPHLKADVSKRIAASATDRSPFIDLPNSSGRRHWGERITAEDMTKLKWVKPKRATRGASARPQSIAEAASMSIRRSH